MMLLGLYLRNPEKLRSSSNNSEVQKEESNEPDYDEDIDQLEDKQEEETGEM
jgi:hypothetical protein